MRRACTLSVPFALAALAGPLTAQTAADYVARGDSLHTALQPAEALEQYRAAYFADPQNAEVLWKFARSQIDVAKQLTESGDDKRADSLYAVARLYAEEAVRVDSTDPEGHFLLSEALGRVSRTKSGKDRVRFAKEIYTEAATALALDPTHDGAHHVLGAWHAEILRLSGVARFFAKTFLGGGFMGMASWDSAVVHLERSIALKPEHVYHRLELAEVLIDLERYAEARDMLARIADLPDGDVLDPAYKRTAARLLAEIRDKS